MFSWDLAFRFILNANLKIMILSFAKYYSTDLLNLLLCYKIEWPPLR